MHWMDIRLPSQMMAQCPANVSWKLPPTKEEVNPPCFELFLFAWRGLSDRIIRGRRAKPTLRRAGDDNLE